MRKQYVYDDIGQISSDAIAKYLYQRDWNQRIDFPNKNIHVFHNDTEDVDILLPAKESLKDYKTMLSYAIEMLSEVEEREIASILNDIKNVADVKQTIDVLSYKLARNNIPYGKIPLLDSVRAINGIKGLVENAFRNEKKSKPYYESKSKNEFNNFFRMAQTEAGSYIFNVETIEMDVPQSEQITLLKLMKISVQFKERFLSGLITPWLNLTNHLKMTLLITS